MWEKSLSCSPVLYSERESESLRRRFRDVAPLYYTVRESVIESVIRGGVLSSAAALFASSRARRG